MKSSFINIYSSTIMVTTLILRPRKKTLKEVTYDPSQFASESSSDNTLRTSNHSNMKKDTMNINEITSTEPSLLKLLIKIVEVEEVEIYGPDYIAWGSRWLPVHLDPIDTSLLASNHFL